MNWTPRLPFGQGPRYLQIVDALEHDISAGAVQIGDRLPTHREMATELQISIGTVSRAYATARMRGLISGEVGRGTFVQAQPRAARGSTALTAPEKRTVDLGLNSPPDTGQDQVLAEMLQQIAADPAFGELLGYLPHQGRQDHRQALAQWLGRCGMDVAPNEVFITHGAQHAISIVTALILNTGQTVLTESLTYSGMLSLAQLNGYRLRGVEMDRHGLLPDALDRAFGESGAKVLYCTPTLQCSFATVMPEGRRREIADVIRRHDAMVIEDDAYGFLAAAPPPPLSTLIPERAFYIVSLAKCLCPGLRIGALKMPKTFQQEAVNAIRSTGWMANAIMAEAAARLIRDGGLEAQVKAKREIARTRVDLAASILGDALLHDPDVPGFHAWLTLPGSRSVNEFIAQLAQSGISLSPQSALTPHNDALNGVRICFGGMVSTAALSRVLTSLNDKLHQLEFVSVV